MTPVSRFRSTNISPIFSVTGFRDDGQCQEVGPDLELGLLSVTQGHWWHHHRYGEYQRYRPSGPRRRRFGERGASTGRRRPRSRPASTSSRPVYSACPCRCGCGGTDTTGRPTGCVRDPSLPRSQNLQDTRVNGPWFSLTFRWGLGLGVWGGGRVRRSSVGSTSLLTTYHRRNFNNRPFFHRVPSPMVDLKTHRHSRLQGNSRRYPGHTSTTCGTGPPTVPGSVRGRTRLDSLEVRSEGHTAGRSQWFVVSRPLESPPSVRFEE